MEENEIPLEVSRECPTCGQHVTPRQNGHDVRRIIKVFKICQGYESEDRKWDDLNYRRCVGPANRLLAFFGSWKTAGDCVQDLYEKYKKIGYTVTMQAIEKHAAEWAKDNLEKGGNRGNVFGAGDGNRADVTRPS
jgi:hypothetical protein